MRRFVYRSSVTGEFVTREYAEANPETTEKQRLKEGDEAPHEMIYCDPPDAPEPEAGPE